jgi:hypothetical protein
MNTPKFTDSYGNEVNVGDKIVMESYLDPKFEGITATVIWNEKRGTYGWIDDSEDRIRIHGTSFMGMQKFKKLETNEVNEMSA